MSKPIESLASGVGADATAFREAIRVMVVDIIDDLFVASSPGAASAGKVAVLDGSGRLAPTLLAPDGFQRVNRIVASLGLDLGNLGDFSGTAFNSALQIHSTDQVCTGLQTIIWGNHTKPALDYIGKSRGAVGEFSALVLGDAIYRKWIQGAGIGGSFGHVGFDNWYVDATPTNAGELAGRYEVATGSGLHVSEADPGRPTYYGLKKALIINSRQQMFVPGVQTIPGGPGTLFPAIVNVGKCGPNAGEANLFFDLTGAVLMTAPVAGAYEVDAAGRHYITDANAKRDRLLTGQVKAAGDAGAIAVGAGAGAGATATVVWGQGCARVTLNTGTGTGAGSLFTLTYPHAFATISFALLQAASAATYGLVGKNMYTNPAAANVEVLAGLGIAASSTFVIDVWFQGD